MVLPAASTGKGGPGLQKSQRVTPKRHQKKPSKLSLPKHELAVAAVHPLVAGREALRAGWVATYKDKRGKVRRHWKGSAFRRGGRHALSTCLASVGMAIGKKACILAQCRKQKTISPDDIKEAAYLLLGVTLKGDPSIRSGAKKPTVL